MATNFVCIIATLLQTQLGYYSSPAPVSGHARGEVEECIALVTSRLQLRMQKCVTTSWKYTSVSGGDKKNRLVIHSFSNARCDVVQSTKWLPFCRNILPSREWSVKYRPMYTFYDEDFRLQGYNVAQSVGSQPRFHSFTPVSYSAYSSNKDGGQHVPPKRRLIFNTQYSARGDCHKFLPSRVATSKLGWATSYTDLGFVRCFRSSRRMLG
jgi:hypothetical protein